MSDPTPHPSIERLNAVNRLTVVSRLLSSAVHDTRNALQIVSGHAEMFVHTAGDAAKAAERGRSILAQCARATDRLQTLVALVQDTGEAPAEKVDLRALAEDLRARMTDIPGIADLQVEKQVLIPQLEIRVDYNRAALYGVQPAALVEQLSRLSNGQVVSRVVDGYRRFDVVMRLSDTMRTTQRLGDLLIETPSGWVPARQIADIRETDGPNQILRENARRRIVVQANTQAGSDMGKIVQAIQEKVAAASLPNGYTTSLEGSFQAQAEASRTIGLLSLLSLALVFALLYSRYRSVVFTLIILGSIPLALIGSVAALWIAGQPLSVASMIGFITLTGIATRNGILKISHYLNLAIHEGLPFGRELVVRGSLERLAPVLMTALSAGVALVPLLVGADAPGKEILHPVAVTIFGGLISATLLDTVLTPVLFLTFGRKPLERLRDDARHRPEASPETPRSATVEAF